MTGERDCLVGKRVTVIGLGIEGVDVARYAATHGATVVVVDAKSSAALSARMQELEGVPVTYAPESNGIEVVAQSDVVFASQGVPLDAPALDAARELGVPIDSMTRALMERCPGPMVRTPGARGETTR